MQPNIDELKAQIADQADRIQELEHFVRQVIDNTEVKSVDPQWILDIVGQKARAVMVGTDKEK